MPPDLTTSLVYLLGWLLTSPFLYHPVTVKPPLLFTWLTILVIQSNNVSL